MTTYMLGKKPPNIPSDANAETHGSQPASLESYAYKKSIQYILPLAFVAVGEDATKNMAHYLSGSGKPVKIDMLRYMRKSKRLSEIYKNEEIDAKVLAEALPPGLFSLASKEVHDDVFDKNDWQHGGRDLFYASGGFKYWGEAEVSIKKISDQKHECEMRFWLYFYDRYNWDNIKSTDLFGKTFEDAPLRALSNQGLAKEFDLNGCIGGVPNKWSYNIPSWVQWNDKPNLDKLSTTRNPRK